jgi:glycosyltransferase involved in cell wall biosynthesis
MVREGHDVYALSSGLPKLEKVREMGCRVYPVEMTRRISLWKDIWAVVRMTRYFRRLRPQIVHAHTPKAGLVGMLASTLAGVSHRVYTVHGLLLETATGLRWRLLWLADRLACRLATHVLVVSHSVKKRLLEEKICPEEKMQILGDGTACGIDVQRFCPNEQTMEQARGLRRQWGIPDEDVVFGFVGRMVPDKGIQPLVDCFVRLHKQRPDLWLLIVGHVDTSREQLMPETLQQIRDHPAIIHVGAVEDTVSYYAAMDALVHPSRREGFSYVILEAAAMTLPVITTRAIGCVDGVVEGKTGWLVGVDQEEELYEAMRRLAAHPDRGRGNGVAGRKRVCSLFTAERLIQEHLSFYEGLLTCGKGKGATSDVYRNRDVRSHIENTGSEQNLGGSRSVRQHDPAGGASS